jgi:DNA-binding transcriptional MerR regulator
MAQRWKIGAVAKLLEVSPGTIRNLEREGKISAPARTQSGYRVYEECDIAGIEEAIYGEGDRRVRPSLKAGGTPM